MNVDIIFDEGWGENLESLINNDGPWGSFDLYKLAVEFEHHLAIPNFEGLQAPKHLANVTPLPHQLEAARQVVETMNGKAILADEVGLGKTIEAGLVLKEYMIRGLVKKVLILVPASLVSQWCYELNTKFFIPAVPRGKVTSGTSVISSYLPWIRPKGALTGKKCMNRIMISSSSMKLTN